MKSIDAYQNFLIKANKNDTSSNIHISKAEFVQLYNEQRLVWLEQKLTKKGTSIDIHDLEDLLITDYELVKVKDYDENSQFDLPSDFFSFDSSYSIASKGSCKNRPLVNWLVKPKNINVLLNDTNNNPSFEYEETICIVSQGKLVIYKSDFSIDKVYLSYYKEPKSIDLEGYITNDGKMSTTIDPTDLNDKSIIEIINRCVMETVRSYENVDALQLAQHRIQTTENG